MFSESKIYFQSIETMKAKFFKKIKVLGVSKKTKILLALSGGVDSMVLMDLLFQICRLKKLVYF